VERASSKRHPVVAFRIDIAPMPAELEYFLNTSHWLDASAIGVEHALPKLVDAVQRALAAADVATPGDAGVAAKPVANLTQQAPITRPASHHVNRPVLTLSVLIALGLGYFAADKLWFSKRTASERPVATVAPATPVAPAVSEKSVAVLPFLDMSEKKDQGYFSDGLSEELIDMLTNVPELRVPARTSSFYFKGKQATIADIAKALSVAHVLEGSVRKSGRTLRITAQLIRADSGYHLWSETYDRNVEDIFKVQDEIAAAVVEALKARLLPSQRVVNQHRTENLEAYREYLLGNQLRARDTTDSNRQALEAYRKAVALDPGYAAAQSGLAVSEWRVADQTTGETAAYQRAAAAADKAISLAPASPDGYWARGTLRYINSYDWSGAQVDFERALALDANDVRTLVSYGRLLATLGRTPEAIAMTRKAIALDPLSAEAWDWLSYYFTCSGQISAARESIKRRLDANPEASDIVWQFELFANGPQAALAALPKHFAESARYGTALAQHSLGHAAESQRALDVLIRDRADSWAYQIATVYAWRGESAQAIEWLERAYRQRDAGMTRLTLDPLLAKLRGDMRFKALVRKMQLPE
jgi:TolB-like protein